MNAILEALAAKPGINRKELAEKLTVDHSAEETESKKLVLASDLRWLISEGHVIEFNDGSLDLPRGKNVTQASGPPIGRTRPVASLPPEQSAGEMLAAFDESAEIGGS